MGLEEKRFQGHPGRNLAAALESGLRELPVRSTAAAHVATLPAHHRDPFDRLLIAQAVTEPAILYTVDPQLDIYSELVHRIQ
jgi:PIN domain nuclease of toxin-antitoxin system